MSAPLPYRATLPISGYTVIFEPVPGDRTKNQHFPVVALVPVGRFADDGYVAALLDSRGNLMRVDQMGTTYHVRAGSW